MAVRDVTIGEFRRGPQRRQGILHLVMLLESGLEPFQYLESLIHRGFQHIDLLKTPRERAILFENAAKLLIGGRADAAQFTGGQHRLDEVGGVHDAA